MAVLLLFAASMSSARAAELAALGVLGPIRNLAGLAIRENIDEFRTRLSAQNTDLRGFVAEPLQGALLRHRLEEVLRQSARDSGRFGLILPTLPTLPGSNVTYDADQLTPEQRELVVRENGIDGFVETSLVFYPDYVSVGMRIRAAADARILAHQSLVIAALPTEAQIYSALLALWARLAEATGHLSAISWQSGDLVTVDLGKPQLQVGQKLIAGHVSSDRVHPRTGEILSFRREAVCELIVLEVNETSSLAKVTEIKLAQAASSKGSGLKGLLVWNHQGVEREPTRLAAANGQAVGSAEVGFDFASEQGIGPQSEPNLTSDKSSSGAAADQINLLSMQPNPAGKKQDAQAGSEAAKTPNLAQAEREAADPSSMLSDPLATDEQSVGAGEGFSLDRPWSEAISDPAHWRPLPFILGAGQSWGILDTAPCDNTPCNRYTGFPATVLNLIQGSARYQITRNAGLSFEGRFSNYPRGDVEGYEIGGRALSVHTMSQSGRDQFVIYGGPDLRIGNAETVLVERSLMALTIRSGAGYAIGTPFGKWQGRADLSFIDLLAGKFFLDATVNAGALPMFPSELGLFLNFRSSPKDFSQIELGAQWTFRSGF
jgi:hypothetical protein